MWQTKLGEVVRHRGEFGANSPFPPVLNALHRSQNHVLLFLLYNGINFGYPPFFGRLHG